jgi:hypothetical protein
MTESDEHGAIGVGGLRGSGHRAQRRRGRGCLPLLIGLLVVAVIGGFAYAKGVDVVKNLLASSPPADYSGNGEKPVVTIEVKSGDTSTDIGTTLYMAGVV